MSLGRAGCGFLQRTWRGLIQCCSVNLPAATTAALGRHNMNRQLIFRSIVLLGFVLSLAGVLSAQNTPDKKLVVNGKTMAGAVRQIDGHSYVDIETLGQITNGTVTFEPNQIVLTMPGSYSPGPNPDATPPPTTQRLSRGFASAANLAVAEMKEWKGALATMVTFGLAAGGGWAQEYHNRVETSVTQASVAATTESDRNALQLLNNEFATLANWASDIVAERQALNGARTVDPNSLQNDRVLAKISDCGRFLNSMLVSGAFVDSASCH